MNWLDAAFLAANFFFLFVSFTFLISFLENHERAHKNPKARKYEDVTIIIPAFNEEKTIARSVRSALALDYPEKVRVIVVDDGSEDATAKKAREAGAKVVKQENAGKAAALNTGIKAAKTPWIACVDADSYVQKDALKKMAGYFNDSEVGAVTGSVKVAEPRNLVQWLQFVEYVGMNYLRKSAAFLNGVSCTPGPLSIYRREALKQVKGFDEGNITEDTEIALNLQRHGWKIENAFNAVAYSHAPYSLRHLLHQRVRWYHGAIINNKKYSYMFFDKKFGNLGWFILPTNIISVLLAFFVTAKMLFLTMGAVTGLAYLFFDPGSPGAGVLLGRLNPLYFFTAEVIIALLYLSVITVVFYLGFKAGDESFKFRHLPVYMLYLFAYSFVVTGAWLVSVSRELRGRKTGW
jgi:cellulose synthase/poly-beta-1,6-N-acetylglucosamine synthase-like glycosyltransferase